MIHTDKKELWLRLRDYNFDHLVSANLLDHVAARFGGTNASTKAFAHKLKSKLRWEVAFALRAIAEYKKFVYLGLTSEFNVTPSKVIDQVWHEHQLFTAGYREFCTEVLGRNFDHYPELVPHEEQTDKFQVQYAATLELYRREFNSEPPASIWSTPKLDPKRPVEARVSPRRKSEDSSSDVVVIDDDIPLFIMFPNDTGGSEHHTAESLFHGFGGGDSPGGGASGTWDGPSGDAHSDGTGHSDASDTSSGDASAGDGGGGDGGGDGGGCSSGCGGS